MYSLMITGYHNKRRGELIKLVAAINHVLEMMAMNNLGDLVASF